LIDHAGRIASRQRHNGRSETIVCGQSRSAPLQVCLGKSTQEALLGGMCLPDLLKFHLKFNPFAPADCEIMQVGQQANRPGIGVGLPLQDMYGDLLPDFRFASR
jgi:hypothetical protein